mgnify:CR=1 FL=1|tara:strand:- start:355 stop:549 length:195 start_codon:yes stop_codon:yes gene_type:complete
MKVNVSPNGKNIGWTRRKEPPKFDELDEAAIKIAEISSAMEDDTEKAINQIEMLRNQTKRKAER